MLFSSLTSVVKEEPTSLYEIYISKIAEGDKNALAALYENTKSAIYGFALSIVQNKQDAEDVLQDTFVNIYISAQNYQKMGKPMAWILTITKNLSLMRIRNRTKMTDLSEEDWGLFISNEKALSEEDRLVLTTALQNITREESQIVILHAVAGFRHREIAETLELPLSTVLSKYNRALKKLKSMLEGDDVRVE